MSTPNRQNMQEGPDRVDYRETRDVTEVHASIKREHNDPRADVTPIPVWLTALCGVVVCWAGAYLGVFHGGFNSTVYNEYNSSPSALFPIAKKSDGKEKAGGAGATQSLAQQGKIVYGQCAACHQGNGAGLKGQFPPLAGSEWVTGSEKRLIAILLKGAQGPMKVKGETYNGLMPPWEGALTDKKIAAVASYIRAEWGNAAPEISEAKVAAARKMFAGHSGAFTEAELLEIPEGEPLPEAEGAAPPAPAAAAPAAGGQSAAAAAEAPAAAQAPATQAPASSAATSATPSAPATPAAPAASATVAATPEMMAEGKKNYMMICVACHQPTGKGLPGVFPPLDKTEYVTGDPQRLAAIILKGVMGPMKVNGTQYNNMMPGQEAVLTDEKIASILTFVRGSFGNSAPPVGPEVVAETRKKFADRKTPWTEAELLAFGGDAAGAPTGTPATSADTTPAAQTPAPPAPAAAPPAASVPQPEAVKPINAPASTGQSDASSAPAAQPPAGGEAARPEPSQPPSAAPADPAPAPSQPAQPQPAPANEGASAPASQPPAVTTPEAPNVTQ